MTIEKFKSSKNNEFYFRVRARNGKTIVASEGYKKRGARDRGIAALFNNLNADPSSQEIVDLEKK